MIDLFNPIHLKRNSAWIEVIDDQKTEGALLCVGNIDYVSFHVGEKYQLRIKYTGSDFNSINFKTFSALEETYNTIKNLIAEDNLLV